MKNRAAHGETTRQVWDETTFVDGEVVAK